MPTLIVQSTYDPSLPFEYTFGQIQCVDIFSIFQTLQFCSYQDRMTIETVRLAILNSLIVISKTRPDIGVWAPACVQHGFLVHPFFNQPIAKVGETLTLAQSVA